MDSFTPPPPQVISVPADATGAHQQTLSQSLFHLYGAFLHTLPSHAAFDFARFEEETRSLPTFYSTQNGEHLLATIAETPAACIAYRTSPEDPNVPYR